MSELMTGFSQTLLAMIEWERIGWMSVYFAQEAPFHTFDTICASVYSIIGGISFCCIKMQCVRLSSGLALAATLNRLC